MGYYHLRRADEPHQVYQLTRRDGSVEELKADDEGVVEPTTPEHVEALDSFGLPVARKAEAAAKNDKPEEPVQHVGPDAPTEEGQA